MEWMYWNYFGLQEMLCNERWNMLWLIDKKNGKITWLGLSCVQFFSKYWEFLCLIFRFAELWAHQADSSFYLNSANIKIALCTASSDITNCSKLAILSNFYNRIWFFYTHPASCYTTYILGSCIVHVTDVWIITCNVDNNNY